MRCPLGSRTRNSGLASIREAKAILEAEAKAAAEAETKARQEAEQKRKAEGRKKNGKTPRPPRQEPEAKAKAVTSALGLDPGVPIAGYCSPMMAISRAITHRPPWMAPHKSSLLMS